MISFVQNVVENWIEELKSPKEVRVYLLYM